MRNITHDEHVPQAGETVTGQPEGTQPEPGAESAVEKTAAYDDLPYPSPLERLPISISQAEQLEDCLERGTGGF